jgi:oligoendopeptidase F
MTDKKRVPARQDVAEKDTWNLAPLFRSDKAWARACREAEELFPKIAAFRGRLGRSAKALRDCCDFESGLSRLIDKIGVYAHLRHSEDVANPACQGMLARFTFIATRAGEAASFIAPEVQAIPKVKMGAFFKSPLLEPYKFNLEKLLRFKPHILSENEERLLAMQGEVAQTPSKVFDQLSDADLKFGTVHDETGCEVELTQGSFRTLLESPKRSVRKEAFNKYYAVQEGHGNTLAAALAGSVLQDVYNARVRNFPSAREAALFGDKVPVAVYDSLIGAVRGELPTLFRYFDIRRRALRTKALHAYDNYVPIVLSEQVLISYDEAVATISAALAPLGDEYVRTLRGGLDGARWVDKYENRNKHSGAYSSGCYDSPPYILMNYKEEVLDSMFTLAHEAGHSMHSHYSHAAQPYQYGDYTIFVAEVASTFNEQLLGHHLFSQAKSRKRRAALINKEIDEIRGTIIRQTMFAEFEKNIHALAEAGEPLTLEVFRQSYRALLEAYFGPDFVIDPVLELEGLRIPHFYRAFYVYKYATGLSAAIALARSVLNGGEKERKRYLGFLQSGGSKYPLDQLRDAGVDLTKSHAVGQAMARFRELVEELDTLV